MVPFDSARRDESNGIYFDPFLSGPPAKVQPTIGSFPLFSLSLFSELTFSDFDSFFSIFV
ncbi:unnamed protein product [Meloidogyne enterolobii]|uniref:Uncharacterized protein n=2 Tax=Meloidogyne enterolobii TaxID=390850 RepID=A0ACB0XU58_MELEN